MRPLKLIVPALAATAAVTAALAAPQGGASASATERTLPAAQQTAGKTGTKPEPDAEDVVLAVHGGAGTALDRATTSPELAKAYRDGLSQALQAGQQVLDRGGNSTDAVQAAVERLEDNPLFNAGKGAVFNADAGHELDASIMRGTDLKAGAVAGVRNVRNPIQAARLVMDESKHVMLAGEGADDFAAAHGLKMVTQDYYFTQARWDALMKAKAAAAGDTSAAKSKETLADEQAKGTVGAVAVDRDKDLAAATSTGGLTNKLPGRVGDSPIIGAGTYAKNGTVAASATGAGEVFIRGAATSTISNLIEFGKMNVPEAAYQVIVKRLPQLGGTGGVIALGPDGTFDAPHSSPGMLYGYLTKDGTITTRIFPDESPANS
ncbi:isoaspartyl peptidase/L-asparaginase family protein [Streptomyces jeddahensis]|uniref:Isoaspartyl peptidase n=1 Tax=Streptomyces jeddahensis TaxID=1716141 RepID=A0A177HT22_9ACTN|nr:isoaspartyl peptidase/L-asparaginase [Streptomyces jeddahensis]OAH13820.1 isoaspartyl peptidase precursor [Streptomyces jeddahensis]